MIKSEKVKPNRCQFNCVGNMKRENKETVENIIPPSRRIFNLPISRLNAENLAAVSYLGCCKLKNEFLKESKNDQK